jgi:hypothetical protein
MKFRIEQGQGNFSCSCFLSLHTVVGKFNFLTCLGDLVAKK